MSKLRMISVVSLVLLGVGCAQAQILSGTLTGNVVDQSQALVPNAAVSVNNKETGLSRETKTDSAGRYLLEALPPGTYELKVTAQGFKVYTQTEVTIVVNNVTRVDVQLNVGAVAEAVTVEAQAATLQTDRSDLHTDIQAKELAKISIGGYRNFQSMLDLVPGTTPSQFQNASTDSPARALTTNVNGTARNSNNTRIDGAASIFTWLPHHAMYIPPLESIQTVNISTNNFDAEQGMSGGAAVNVITKSGTNQFHGVLFAYHLNHKWAAKPLFFNPNTPAGPNTPQRIDNQYGGTVGGPIKKDKIFFFASWEGTTTAERGNAILSVPTPQVRAGNFTGLTTVFDPRTGDSVGRNRTAFANNIIPDSRISAATKTLLAMIPLPNTPASCPTGQVSCQTNNYFASAPYYFKRDLVDGKLDWRPTAKLSTFGKYSVMIAPISSGAPLGEALGGYPGGAAGAAGIGTGHNTTHVFGGGVTYVISPTLVFDANFGGSLLHHDTTGPDFGKNVGLDVLKIPGSNGPTPRQSGFPIFNISGYTSLGNTNNWSPVERNDRVYTFTTNLSWTRGAHNIRFGFDGVEHQINHWQPELGGYSPRGGFNFTANNVTGCNNGAIAGGTNSCATAPSANNFNGFASLLLGLPGTFGKAYQFYDPMKTREFMQGYYIRDNWQATRKLSINLGLRMEHFPIMHRGSINAGGTNVDIGIERYDPTTNKVLIGGLGSNPRTAGTDSIGVMFGPRVGFAYRWNDKTVIRAGFGITNDPYPLGRPIRSPYPAVIVQEFLQADSRIPTGCLNQADCLAGMTAGIPAVTFPNLAAGTLDIPNTIATNTLQPGKFRRGYIESFNLTVQRELGRGFALQAGYVGTRSIRQALTYFEGNAGIVIGGGNAGRPLFNRFGVTAGRQFYIPMAGQRYDALQTQLTRRFAGMFITSSFTWSKVIGINAGNSDSGLRFYVPSQYSKNRAVADFDRTLTWVTAMNYETPFGKGKKWATSGFGAAVLGGWTINPSLAIYSGTPFIVTADGGSLNATNNTQVADQIAEPKKIGGVGTGAFFYDPTSFSPVCNTPAPGGGSCTAAVRFGNMGLNAIRGPKAAGMNLGLFRTFQITERWNVQFRAEALNLTNTPALSNPNANVSGANFMKITSTIATVPAPQRVIRFGLRAAW